MVEMSSGTPATHLVHAGLDVAARQPFHLLAGLEDEAAICVQAA